ncbi:MAG: hypothetical protein C0410_06310 [Anaerolinea sp.]|nr:hypothetical protein [Anaerolinea sp.]
MKNIQKIGGIGSLIGAATNLFALGVFATFLVPNGEGSDYIAFIADNQSFMRVFDIIIYLVFGVGMIFLSLALNERLKAGSPSLAQTVTTFGLIYAVLVIVVGTLSMSSVSTVVKLFGDEPTQAATVWLTLESVGNGLGGGGGETMISGLWILFLSCVALQAREFPRMLNYFGLMVGVAGILSVFFPSFLGIAVFYGLGLISWLAWLGIVMLRNIPVLSRSPSQG